MKRKSFNSHNRSGNDISTRDDEYSQISDTLGRENEEQPRGDAYNPAKFFPGGSSQKKSPLRESAKFANGDSPKNHEAGSEASEYAHSMNRRRGKHSRDTESSQRNNPKRRNIQQYKQNGYQESPKNARDILQDRMSDGYNSSAQKGQKRSNHQNSKRSSKHADSQKESPNFQSQPNHGRYDYESVSDNGAAHNDPNHIKLDRNVLKQIEGQIESISPNTNTNTKRSKSTYHGSQKGPSRKNTLAANIPKPMKRTERGNDQNRRYV